MANIHFEKFILPNGLRVIVHPDPSTPLACLNIMYDVGSRDENPDRTGFAHLFEHLMFGGSANIAEYDKPLQLVGGTNNAFTSTDITNYYLTVPAQELETGFWLESDRMLNLAFTPKSLEVQRQVVIEEFRQRYLNQPYGDAWLLLRPLVYTTHPYLWATIGKEEAHIAEATMNDVRAFFDKHYRPSNAVMTVAGNVTTQQVHQLAEKWFGPIVKGDAPVRQLPTEPDQTKSRRLVAERNVPLDAVYIAFRMCGRQHPDYAATDLISDLLGKGTSARLYQSLVKESHIFSDVHAFVMGERDPSMFVVSGHLNQGVDVAVAEAAVWNQLNQLATNDLAPAELEKVKNQAESLWEFAHLNLLNRAISLSYHELLGDAANINSELDHYRAVSAIDIARVARTLFRPENSSTLIYKAI